MQAMGEEVHRTWRRKYAGHGGGNTQDMEEEVRRPWRRKYRGHGGGRTQAMADKNSSCFPTPTELHFGCVVYLHCGCVVYLKSIKPLITHPST